MQRVEELFDDLTQVYVQRSDYFYNPKNLTLKKFEASNFNVANRSVDLQMQFESPFDLGLNTEKSDYVYF